MELLTNQTNRFWLREKNRLFIQPGYLLKKFKLNSDTRGRELRWLGINHSFRCVRWLQQSHDYASWVLEILTT